MSKVDFIPFPGSVAGEPERQLAAAGNVFCRLMVFNQVGDASDGHAHTYDHFTLLATGSVRVEVNGENTDYLAPCLIPIAHSFPHRIVALTDNVIACCIHALHKRDNPSEILDENLLPRGINLHDFSVPLLEPDARAQGFKK